MLLPYLRKFKSNEVWIEKKLQIFATQIFAQNVIRNAPSANFEIWNQKLIQFRKYLVPPNQLASFKMDFLIISISFDSIFRHRMTRHAWITSNSISLKSNCITIPYFSMNVLWRLCNDTLYQYRFNNRQYTANVRTTDIGRKRIISSPYLNPLLKISAEKK